MSEQTPGETAALSVIKLSEAKDGLRRAIAKATAIGKDVQRPVHERARAFALAEDLDRQLSALTTAQERLRAIASTPSGPNQDVLKQAIALAEELARHTAEEILAAGTFEAIVGVVVALSELAPAGSPAVASSSLSMEAAADVSGAERAKRIVAHSAASWLASMQGQ
jgi:hypothetical protein